MTQLRSGASSSAGEIRSAPYKSHGTSAFSGHLVWPASGDRSESRSSTVWMHWVRSQAEDLLEFGDDWDGYGSRPLHPAAIDSVFPLLSRYGQFIQDAPALALTAEGGVICRWKGDNHVLEIESDQAGDLSIYFSDDLVGYEYQGPVKDAAELDKWLWQASGNLSR